MKLLLTKAARIRHNAGEIVEVSPAEAGFLLSTGSAVEYADPVKAETPEAMLTAEMPEAEKPKETPEAKTPKKGTRTKK